ncbi:hypothetical protein, partial [Ornithinibacillus xuwenensis]
AAQTFNLPMDIENKPTKNGSNHHFLMFGTTFHLFLASYVPASSQNIYSNSLLLEFKTIH